MKDFIRMKSNTDLKEIKIFLDKLSLKRISGRGKDELMKDVTVEERGQQIKEVKMGKTAGDDGDTNEFYRTLKNTSYLLILRA